LLFGQFWGDVSFYYTPEESATVEITKARMVSKNELGWEESFLISRQTPSIPPGVDEYPYACVYLEGWRDKEEGVSF